MAAIRFHICCALAVALIGSGPMSARAATAELSPSANLMDFPIAGIPFVIELNLHNAGPDTVTTATLTDVLPAQWSVVSCDILPYLRGWTIGTPYDPNAVPPSWTNYGNTVVCNGGTIYYGYYRTFYLKVVANQPGTFSHPISVSAAGVFDTWPANNQMSQTVTVRSNGVFVLGGQVVVESSGSNVVFTVVIVPSNSVPVTVDYATGGGTATGGQDYQYTAGTLTFAPGVTNQTVSVPILNDTLAEVDSQSFTLLLTNAVNVELSGQAQSNSVIDDEPEVLISISNAAPVVEGFAETNLLFPVVLSNGSDVALSIAYTVTGALTNSGYLSVPAGVTNHFLAVPVVGDLAIQSNRTVTASLAAPTPHGVITVATATGTIIEEDGLPGNFAYLEISTVPSPQIVGRPFTVMLTARDVFNELATNYVSDFVGVTAYRRVGYSSVFEQTIYVSNFVIGVSSATFTYANVSTNSRIVAWKPVGLGYAPVSTPDFKVIASPQLTVTATAFATEGDGMLSGVGLVTLPGVDGQDVEVHLSTSDALELGVPASVFIPAGQTSAVFDVTIVDDARLDGMRSSWIYANATAYLSASRSVLIQDNETAVLSMALPTGLSEAKGFATGSGTVIASAPPDFPILVRLTSSDTTELTVPTSVYLQSGQTSVTFTVTVPDDSIIDGPQTPSVTAQYTNWTSGTALTTVLDDDTNVTLNFFWGNKSPIEGAGLIADALQVRLGGFTSNDVLVQLFSSDESEAFLPAAVLIRAGQQMVYTNITLPEDNEFDGTQTITLTGTAPGFLTGTRTLAVPDNDPHHFTFNPIAANQASGVPFSVTIAVKDVNDAVMTSYRSNLTLSAVHNGGFLPTTPGALVNLARGSWSGNVTIHHWGTNLQLRVATTNGTFSLSNPFTIPMPAWAEDLRIDRVERDGADVVLFFPSSTGRVYQVESTTNAVGAAWTVVGPAQAGTGSELSVRDPHAAGPAVRLYRLAVPVP